MLIKDVLQTLAVGLPNFEYDSETPIGDFYHLAEEIARPFTGEPSVHLDTQGEDHAPREFHVSFTFQREDEGFCRVHVTGVRDGLLHVEVTRLEKPPA